jgi:TolB protein
MKKTILGMAGLMFLAGCAGKTVPAVEGEAAALSGVTQLTFGKDFERAGEAYFSPDMRWVVFQAVPKGVKGGESGYQMYVARLVFVRGVPAGLTLVTRVSPAGSRNTCGHFSQDSRTLMFASTAGKDDPEEASPGYQREGSRYRWAFSKGMEIYVVHDFEAKLLAGASEGMLNFALPQHRITDNLAYDAECAFSPDGKWVVFCSDRESRVDTAPSAQASTAPQASSAPTATPAPTATDALTATTAPTATPAPRQLWAMRTDGTGLVQLTATGGYNGGPFFSPDGRRLVYRSDRAGNDLLQVLTAELVRDRRGNITGLRDERKVTDDANVNWGPYWSPDGRRIVYSSSKVSHANYELFSRRADGSRETRLTWSAGPDVLPVVSPDGRWLMWSSRRGEDKTTQVYVARFTFPAGS